MRILNAKEIWFVAPITAREIFPLMELIGRWVQTVVEVMQLADECFHGKSSSYFLVSDFQISKYVIEQLLNYRKVFPPSLSFDYTKQNYGFMFQRNPNIQKARMRVLVAFRQKNSTKDAISTAALLLFRMRFVGQHVTMIFNVKDILSKM